PETDYEAAARWLEARGFTVRRWAGRVAIGFTGTAGQVERAFAVALHRRAWRGREFVAPVRAPEIHAFGPTRVRAVVGLDTVARPHPLLRVGDGNRLAPADLQTVFGLGDLYARGITGAGASIAVLATSDFSIDDVST